MNEINYSIIIPHKNIPQLLQRCLDSIPIRDDVQVIVVDDNSEPEKVNFEDFPKWKGPNYEYYFTKEGKGAGYARNVGLEHAKGKWILFADADDYFNYCISEILEEYIDNQADVVYFDSSSQNCYLYTNSNRSTYTHQMILLYKKNKQEGEFQLRYYLGVPWAKLIKYETIKKYDIKFDETPINNDTTFAYLLGLNAKDIAIDERALYCITVRTDSISYILSDEKILTSIEVFARKRRTLLDNGIDIYEGFIPFHISHIKKKKRHDLYQKSISILKKYGFDESLIYKESWMPPILDENNYEALEKYSSFFYSDFGQNMFYAYFCKGYRYKLFILITKVLNKIKFIC